MNKQAAKTLTTKTTRTLFGLSKDDLKATTGGGGVIINPPLPPPPPGGSTQG